VSLSFFAVSFWLLPPGGGLTAVIAQTDEKRQSSPSFSRRYTHQVNNNLEQKEWKEKRKGTRS